MTVIERSACSRAGYCELLPTPRGSSDMPRFMRRPDFCSRASCILCAIQISLSENS